MNNYEGVNRRVLRANIFALVRSVRLSFITLILVLIQNTVFCSLSFAEVSIIKGERSGKVKMIPKNTGDESSTPVSNMIQKIGPSAVAVIGTGFAIGGPIGAGVGAGAVALGALSYAAYLGYQAYNDKNMPILVLDSSNVRQQISALGPDVKVEDLLKVKNGLARKIGTDKCSDFGLNLKRAVASDRYGKLRALKPSDDLTSGSTSKMRLADFKPENSAHPAPHWVLNEIECTDEMATGESHRVVDPAGLSDKNGIDGKAGSSHAHPNDEKPNAKPQDVGLPSDGYLNGSAQGG